MIRWLGALLAIVLLIGSGFALNAARTARTAREAAKLEAALEEEILAYERRDRSRPPLFPPAVEGVAFDDYREACEAFDGIDTYGDLLDPCLAFDEWAGAPSPLPDEAVAYVEALSPVSALLRRGARTASSGFAADLRRGDMTDARSGPAPRELLFAKSIQSELVGGAMLALSRGRPADAVDLLLVGDRLIEDLRHGASGLEALTAAAFQKRPAMALARLVGAGALPDGEIDRLRAVVRVWLEPDALSWQLLDGRWLGMQADLLHIIEGRPSLLTTGPFRQEWYEKLVSGSLEPGPAEALKAWKRLRDDVAELRALYPTGSVEDRRCLGAELGRRAARSSPTYQMFAGSLVLTTQVELRCLDLRREGREYILLNLALHRFRRRNGRDPETIEEIRPPEVRPVTSEGPWDWRSRPDVDRRWIEPGRAEDVARRQQEAEAAAADLIETFLDRD